MGGFWGCFVCRKAETGEGKTTETEGKLSKSTSKCSGSADRLSCKVPIAPPCGLCYNREVYPYLYGKKTYNTGLIGSFFLIKCV